METYERFCQSCSMPLEEGKQSGTEKNGEKSKLYCHYCYEDGEYTDPNMTLEKMKNILDETIGKEGLKGKFLAWIGKMTLPSLKRWKV